MPDTDKGILPRQPETDLFDLFFVDNEPEPDRSKAVTADAGTISKQDDRLATYNMYQEAASKLMPKKTKPQPKPRSKKKGKTYSVPEPKPVAEVSKPEAESFMPGQFICHVRYDDGLIISKDGDWITVDFPKFGTKKLYLTACLQQKLIKLYTT